MKRIFALCLLLVLLLSACGERVPTYEQPETSVPTDPLLPEETEPTAQMPVISQANGVQSVPKDDSVLRLERAIALGYATGESVYFATYASYLMRYDEEKDRLEACCRQEGCAHVDESCGAWVGKDVNGLYFAVREDTAYYLWGEREEYGEYKNLQFFSSNLANGQRRNYCNIAVEPGQLILLGDLLVCGNKAVLSYAIGEDYEGHLPQRKTQYILAFDLIDGTTTTVMCREIPYFTTYDLWGMSESHLILAYHHGIGIDSYGSVSYKDTPTYGYDEYVRDVHRWVLLEYPIAEDADWSRQVSVSDSTTKLELFSYSSFYGGKLYYLADSYLKVYDLSDHTNKVLFYLPGVENLFCADGKVFYRTYAREYFYYDPATEQTVQYQKDTPREQFIILGETDDSFLGKTATTLTWQRISKEDFYEENYDALVAYPFV